MTSSTRLVNFFERVGWTLIQVVTAEGLIAAINTYQDPDLNQLWVAVIATLLAAIKNAVAGTFVSPTGATLPEGLAPVLAEHVAARLSGDITVAGPASPIPTGDEVEVIPR